MKILRIFNCSLVEDKLHTMEKRVLVGLMTILCLINLVSAEIRINEVEINPYEGNSQWIELYSDNPLSLNEWSITEKNNKTKVLDNDIQTYLLIDLGNQFFDSENEVIKLSNQNSVVYQTIAFSDSYSNGKSWNYCNSSWIFTDSTPGNPNICPVSVQNNSKNETLSELQPHIDLEWNDDEIINGKDFDITVSALDLADAKYDVKIYIYRDNNENKIISESYYRTDWFYSGVYISGFFIGPGNKTRDESLRISELYRDFNGTARIKLSIKEAYNPNFIANIDSSINVLNKNTVLLENPATVPENPIPEIETPSATGEVIKIESVNSAEINNQNESNLFMYSIVIFIILIIIFVILFVLRIMR